MQEESCMYQLQVRDKKCKLPQLTQQREEESDDRAWHAEVGNDKNHTRMAYHFV